jgi:hypothetical protein
MNHFIRLQPTGKAGSIVFSGDGDFHAALPTGLFLWFGEVDATAHNDTSDTVCAPYNVYDQSSELIFSGWSAPAPRIVPERQFFSHPAEAFH